MEEITLAKTKYTDEAMLLILKDYIDIYGIPKSKSFNAKNGYPATESYRLRFGSWHNAIILCGAKIPDDKLHFYQNNRLDDESLLCALEKITTLHLIDNNYLLNNSDFNKYVELQSYSVYLNRFGGIREAYNKIGIDYDAFNKIRMECDMLNKLTEVSELIGHAPNTFELNYYSRNYDSYYSATAYDHHFGNITNALIAANLQPYGGALTKRMNNEDMLGVLRKIHKETGKYPNQLILNTNSQYPNYSTYVRKFGSWENAMIQAFGKKIIQLSNVQYTPKGKKCRSLLEYIFACMLEKHNISYVIDEIYYKDFINDLNKRYRFDFLIKMDNLTYLVEIFGMIGFKNYNESVNQKLLLCKNNNIPLIDLYASDIHGKSQDQLYNLLLNKMDQIRFFTEKAII